MPYVALRYMNVYGPRQDYSGAYIAVIMRMLDAIDRDEPLTLYGDGSQAYDFVYVGDCAAANVCAMRADTVDRAYNVGTGTRTSIGELARDAAATSRAPTSASSTCPKALTFVRNRIGSTERARDEIGFEATVELEEGLRALIEWRQAHQDQLRTASRARADLVSAHRIDPDRGARARRRGVARAARAARVGMADAGSEGRRLRGRLRASVTGSTHALATTSCTTALHLCLAALGIGPGDEVIVPAFTWVATANAVVYCGATPVFADVDRQTYNIDPADVAAKAHRRARARSSRSTSSACAPTSTRCAPSFPRASPLVEDAACAAGAALRRAARPGASAISLRSPSTRASRSPPARAAW